jgi:hypothetical protein
MSNYGRLRALDDILKERDQFIESGRSAGEYMFDISNQAAYASMRRNKFVTIAAYALAAIESIDSKEKPSANS